MKKAKQRVHNEWFRSINAGGRKSCKTCKQPFGWGERQWTWGEYHNARWYTVGYFCKECFVEQVQDRLLSHAGTCGCAIELQGKGEKLPFWLTLIR